MDGVRMMNVQQVKLDSRTIGGSALLIPFEFTWLVDHTCRQLLSHVREVNFCVCHGLRHVNSIAYLINKVKLALGRVVEI